MDVRNYFNGIAPRWDVGQSAEEEKILDLLSRLNIGGANTILDMGCGTGILFPHIKKMAHHRARVFAIDISECMAERALQNGNSSIHVICGDIQQLPFPDNVFHCIIAFQVFPHIHHIEHALKECHRVLIPHGEIGIIHQHSSEELNVYHATLPEPVKNHLMPSGENMKLILERNYFKVGATIDKPGEYFVSAQKSQ